MTYVIDSAWNTGYVVRMTLTNVSDQAWNGWSLTFRTTPAPQYRNTWGVRLSPSGQVVHGQPESYDANVAPGAQAQFGAEASTPGYGVQLFDFAVNGHPCVQG